MLINHTVMKSVPNNLFVFICMKLVDNPLLTHHHMNIDLINKKKY